MTIRCPSIFFEAEDFIHRTETVRGLEMDDPPMSAPSGLKRPWLYEDEAAERLGLTKRALQSRRLRGAAPAHHQRVGGAAYFVDDLDAWRGQRPG